MDKPDGYWTLIFEEAILLKRLHGWDDATAYAKARDKVDSSLPQQSLALEVEKDDKILAK